MKEKNSNKNNQTSSKGITLIALVITIIVMLILVAVTVNMTINGGLFGYASKAKDQAEIDQEKEFITLAYLNLEMNNEDIDSTNMKRELTRILNKDNVEVMSDGDIIVIQYTDSKRAYIINSKGGIEKYTIKKDEYPGDITHGINGEVLAGTESNPYEIWCIEDLVVLSQEKGAIYQDKYIALMKTLDFKSDLSYADPNTQIYNTYLQIPEEKVDKIGLKEALTNKEYNGFKPLGSNNGYTKYCNRKNRWKRT